MIPTAEIKEPLTNEGWMVACHEAREERDRLRARIVGRDVHVRDLIQRLQMAHERDDFAPDSDLDAIQSALKEIETP